MRLAKVWFRLRHLVQFGMMPFARLELELLTNGTPAKPRRVLFPHLGL
jgi:hypothetical protein